MRPRTVTDDELLHAAARAVGRVGPVNLTLADVGREAGIAPATLVQRFGSKRGLLLALVRQGAQSTQSLSQWRAAHASPSAALMAFAQCMAGMAETPQSFAHHLGFLLMDITDDEFHQLTLAQAKAYQLELTKWFDEAVAAKEIIPCNTKVLARLFTQMLNGALLAWAIFREGDAQAWVKREMLTFLKPYLRTASPRKTKSK